MFLNTHTYTHTYIGTHIRMRSYETLVLVCQTTRHHIPKHCDFLEKIFFSPRKLPPSFIVGFGRDTIRISAGTRDMFYVVCLSSPREVLG